MLPFFISTTENYKTVINVSTIMDLLGFLENFSKHLMYKSGHNCLPCGQFF